MRKGGEEGLIAIAVIIVLLFKVLMYVAIVAGVCLGLYGLFLLIRWLFIGHAKNNKADPLFSKAAKAAVKNESFDYQGFAQRHSISDDRSRFILKQLRIAGVMDGNTVLVDKLWKLRSVFRSINVEEDFFITRLQEEVFRIQSAIEQQAKNELNADVLSVLATIQDNVEAGMKLDYYKSKLKAIQDFSGQDEIEALKKGISDITLKSVIVDISEGNDIMQRFDDFDSCFTYEKTVKTWNNKHQRLCISQDSFCDIHINGKPLKVPTIADSDVEIYFYPSFAIVFRRHSPKKTLKVIDYLTFSVSTRSFTEPESSWFETSDASVVYRKWLHSKVNGGPDLRYKHNPSTAYYAFYKAKISPIQIDVISGNSAYIDKIEKAFAIISKPTRIISNRTLLRSQAPLLKPSYDKSYPSELDGKIAQTIRRYCISEGTIDNGTLVSILSDYQIFSSMEEKAYARILRQAIQEGVLAIVMDKGPTSIEGINAIKNFVASSGFDETKTEFIIKAIYYGFRSMTE